MTVIGLVLATIAALLLYGAIKGKNPIEVVKSIASSGRP